MRKVVALLTALAVFSISFASAPVGVKPSVLHADKIFIPLGKTGQVISLQELSRIRLKTLESLTGNKMKFFDRVAFKVAQKKLRNSINTDGSISNKKIARQIKRAADAESGFHIGGFALGFILGPIGVLICYLINDDYKQNRVRWSWRGFLAALLLSLAILGAAGGV